MAEKEKIVANGKDQKILQHDIEEIDKKVEEVQQMELAAKDQIVASKSFIYVIIALLIYLTFLVIPDIDKRMTLIEKDSQGEFHTSQHGQVRFVPMIGAAQE